MIDLGAIREVWNFKVNDKTLCNNLRNYWNMICS